MDIDIKKIIEGYLEYEIHDYKMTPIFDGNQIIGLDIKVQPNYPLQYINCKVTLSPSGNIDVVEL